MPTENEYKPILKNPHLSTTTQCFKGVLKIALGNMAYYPITWPLIYPIAAFGMVVGGVAWGLGKYVLKDGEDKEKLISNGKDLFLSSILLSVPFVGPTALIVDGCVNIATQSNYGPEGMANSFHNAKVFANRTNQYAQNKYQEGKNFSERTKNRINENVNAAYKTVENTSKAINDTAKDTANYINKLGSKNETPDIENQLGAVQQPSLLNKIAKLVKGAGIKIEGSNTHKPQSPESRERKR